MKNLIPTKGWYYFLEKTIYRAKYKPRIAYWKICRFSLCRSKRYGGISNISANSLGRRKARGE